MKNDDNELQYYLNDLELNLSKSFRSKIKLRQILKMYQYVGIFTAFAGIIYFLLTSIKIELTTSQRMAVMISGIGITLTVFSKLLIDYINEREIEKEKFTYERETISNYIITWIMFEKTINNYIENKKIKTNKFSINSSIQYLYKSKLIDDKDIVLIERSLELRNLILHKGITASTVTLNELILGINEIISKINNKKKLPKNK